MSGRVTSLDDVIITVPSPFCFEISGDTDRNLLSFSAAFFHISICRRNPVRRVKLPRRWQGSRRPLRPHLSIQFLLFPRQSHVRIQRRPGPGSLRTRPLRQWISLPTAASAFTCTSDCSAASSSTHSCSSSRRGSCCGGRSGGFSACGQLV